MKTDRLLQDLGGGHADRTWENRLTKYILADLLVLDDFGMKELSPQEAEDLYELICERYRGGSMIVVSNRAPKDWYALFPNRSSLKVPWTGWRGPTEGGWRSPGLHAGEDLPSCPPTWSRNGPARSGNGGKRGLAS